MATKIRESKYLGEITDVAKSLAMIINHSMFLRKAVLLSSEAQRKSKLVVPRLVAGMLSELSKVGYAFFNPFEYLDLSIKYATARALYEGFSLSSPKKRASFLGQAVRFFAAIIGVPFAITISPIVKIFGKMFSGNKSIFSDVRYWAEFGKFALSAAVTTCGLIYGFSAVAAGLQTGTLATLIPSALLAKVTTFAALGASIGFPAFAIAIAVTVVVALVLYGAVKLAEFCYHKYQKHQLHKKGYFEPNTPKTSNLHALGSPSPVNGSSSSLLGSSPQLTGRVLRKGDTHRIVARRLGFGDATTVIPISNNPNRANGDPNPATNPITSIAEQLNLSNLYEQKYVPSAQV